MDAIHVDLVCSDRFIHLPSYYGAHRKPTAMDVIHRQGRCEDHRPDGGGSRFRQEAGSGSVVVM